MDQFMRCYDGPLDGKYLMDCDAVPDGGRVHLTGFPNGFYLRCVDWFQWVAL